MTKLVWTDENTKSVETYKASVRSGQTKPVVLSGTLREVIKR
ncbi:MAG TPA: hypothetical protein VGA92_05720 [Candidatus Nitrosotenuis sp.]|jgi:hypothetical protein